MVTRSAGLNPIWQYAICTSSNMPEGPQRSHQGPRKLDQKKQYHPDPDKENSDSAGCAGLKADGMGTQARSHGCNYDQGCVSLGLHISIGDRPFRLLIVPAPKWLFYDGGVVRHPLDDHALKGGPMCILPFGTWDSSTAPNARLVESDQSLQWQGT